jgi:hypothetical protein
MLRGWCGLLGDLDFGTFVGYMMDLRQNGMWTQRLKEA